MGGRRAGEGPGQGGRRAGAGRAQGGRRAGEPADAGRVQGGRRVGILKIDLSYMQYMALARHGISEDRSKMDMAVFLQELLISKKATYWYYK